MFNQVSLDMAPSLNKPLRFFLMAFIGLFIASIYLLAQFKNIQTRWDQQFITLTHLYTIGFLFPLFLGAITQLSPVLFGLNINFNKIIKPFYYILPIVLFSFATNFHHSTVYQNFWLVSILTIFWSWITFLSVNYIKQGLGHFYQNKNVSHLILSLSFFNLLIGLFLSIILVLGHLGINIEINFRPHLTNMHMLYMFLGFFINLFVSIIIHVIPMFFVTQFQNTKYFIYNSIILTLALFLNLFFESQFFYLIYTFNLQAISILILKALKNRKRKLKDPIIYLWYIVLINLILLPFLSFIHFKFDLLFSDYFLGLYLALGILLPLIMSMLLKIVPFLLWLHLNNLNLANNFKKMNLPHMKEYILDRDIWNVYFLILFIITCVVANQLFLIGLMSSVFAVYVIYLIINGHKKYQIEVFEIENS